MARNSHMDLIEVAPNADPPVCRIIDYGRFQYEREKKERAAKKSQKTFDVKGVQVRPKTTEHHLAFKIRSARRFLEQGNKVKVSLKFRGRESAHLHVARQMLDKFIQGTADIAVVEQNPNVEGKAMLLILAPTQATLSAAHLKTTQARIEAEREADVAAGFVDDEDDDLDEDADDEADAAVVDSNASVNRSMTEEDKAKTRKELSRAKLVRKRANEQLELP